MAGDIGVFSGLPEAFTGAFGEPVIYQPVAGGSFEISAIYIDPFQAVEVSGISVSVESVSHELHVRAGDVPDAEHGDQVTIREVDFHVVGVEPDGKGMVRLVLHQTYKGAAE